MKSNLEKICQSIIWGGLFLAALSPFLLFNVFYFPFVYSKVLVFRVAVGVMLIFYLILCSINSKYHPRITKAFLLVLAWFAVSLIASLFGVNWYSSFWGNMERGGGILTMLHLVVFFIIISSFLKEKKQWFLVFDFSLFTSLLHSIFALGQKFEIPFFLNTQGARVSSTIGNGAFLAGYLLFHIFIALVLFFNRRNVYAKFYYVFLAIFNAYIIVQTSTRGAVLALGISLFLTLIFIISQKNVPRKIKTSALGVFLFVIVCASAVYYFRETPIIKNSSLSRLTKISLKHPTIQSRFMTWNASWQGWKERFWLGYGLENFKIPFNKYFDPKLYQEEGSIVWFDKAHNIIFDTALTTGLVGLIVYLLLLGYVPIMWWKHFYKQDVPAAILFILAIIAYFIQNFFVFDTINTYILFILILGYTSFYEREYEWKNSSSIYYKFILVIYILVFIPLQYFIHYKPALASYYTILGMDQFQKGKFSEADESFRKSLALNTYGNHEYRIRYAESADTLAERELADENFIRPIVINVTSELKKQIFEEPLDVANYLLLMRHYIYTGIYNPDYYYKVLELFPKSLELSPKRQHLYDEAGYAQVFLGNFYEKNGDNKKAKKFYLQAMENFKRSIELNDRVVESHINLVSMYLAAGLDTEVISYLKIMDEKKINYKKPTHLRRLGNTAVNNEKYEFANKFFLEIVNNQDQIEIQDWINVALSYAYIGQDAKAIEIAEKVSELFPESKKNSDIFIENIKAGVFRDEGKRQQYIERSKSPINIQDVKIEPVYQ